MKKILITLMLLTSMFAYAGPKEDEEDAIAGEQIGMTLEGYRSSEAYREAKTKKSQKSPRLMACERRLAELEARDRKIKRQRDTIREQRPELDAQHAALERQYNSRSREGAYARTLQMKEEYDEALSDFDSMVARYNQAKNDYNDDVDTYNNECAR